MRIDLAILRSAAWLVPSERRAEWFAEWNAELWYVRQDNEEQAIGFCQGAFQDAFWVRRNSQPNAQSRLYLQLPSQCLGFLGLVAAACILFAFRYSPPDCPLRPIGQSVLAMLVLASMALPGVTSNNIAAIGRLSG